MEKEINIAEILKDKPQGTKLYDLLRNIDVELDKVHITDVGSYIVCTATNEAGSTRSFGYSKLGTEECWLNGLQILFPSKEMRDWRNFAWKKGDVLICKDNTHIIFEKFEDNTYTRFKGKHYLFKLYTKEDYCKETPQMTTSSFEKANDYEAQSYIKTIEKKLGGKFNRETLEVEKPHPEFKDGDIITITPQIGDNLIFIFRAEDVEKYYCHAFLDGNIAIVNDDSYCQKDFCTVRPSTEEEQKQVFEALAEKGKAWDAEKKAIVDLKPKCEFKPFDRCIWKIRNCEGSIWQASFVSYVDEYGATPMGMSIDEDLVNLIILPYNDQTKLLVGTTDEWEGGDQ